MTTDEASIRQVFDSAAAFVPGGTWAACKLDFSIYKDQGYNYAFLMYFPLIEMITMENFDEEKQYSLMNRSMEQRSRLKKVLLKEAAEHDVKLHVPSVHIDHISPPYMISLSAKEIAVKAGIGWIGKNDLIISREYGTRICTIGGVFYADSFRVDEPVTESKCGSCDLCVKACPFHNITGKEWGRGITRDDLVDYHRCSVIRFAGIKKIGHKISCARCVSACPVCVENVEKVIGSCDESERW